MRALFEQQANAIVAQFVALNPTFRIDAEQPAYRGGTNYITFGRHGDEPVVFKVFVSPARWRNELWCLRHFAQTGYVPHIRAVVPDQMVVITRLPNGDDGGVASATTERVSYAVGQALGAFAQADLPLVEGGYSPVRDFHLIAWGTNLGAVIDRYLAIGYRAQQAVEAYQTPFFSESLALIASQRDVVAAQPPLLFHEDISNLAVDEGAFQGFYDLEMCRLGTEAMQLGVALGLCAPQNGFDWSWLRQGYERRTGRSLGADDMTAILAMNHFYHLIRVCRWGNWDGDPAQQEHARESALDAGWHMERMREACVVMQGMLVLDNWFPSLRDTPAQTR